MGSLAARAAKARDGRTTIRLAELGEWGFSIKCVHVFVRESDSPANTGHVARRISERAGKPVR